MHLVPRILAGLGLSACASLATAAIPDIAAADLILRNGKIVTVDEHFAIEQAIAIRGEHILDVGSNSQIMALAGGRTRIVDLRGATVIPGLIDNHHHFLSKAVDQYLGVDVTLVESIAEMAELIGEKARQTPPGELIYTTSGWMQEQLAEGRTPTRQDLDAASPHHPVVIQGGHSLYLNSYALREAGITRDTPSPEGGSIEKDPATGEPTGRLIENATHLADMYPRGAATYEQKMQALRAAQPKLNAVGLTGLREAGIPAADMRIYQDLYDQNALTLRFSLNYHLPPTQPAEELIDTLETWGVRTGFGDHMLRLDGIGEFGIDGGFEAGLMSQHYVNAPGNAVAEDYYGLQRIPTEKFEQVMQAMSRLGWRASVHIVGDRGLDIALDAYEKASKTRDITDRRWVVEHAHFTRPDQFQRIKALGVVISTQFHPYMAARSMEYFWGKERASQTMRLRDWLDAGLVVGGGSDWSLLPANPFWMLHFWVTRDVRLGGPSTGPDQAISRAEALRVMTINNAYLTFEEAVKGSLEPGKLADLVVLDRDYLTVPEAQIRDIRPIATLLGGQVVYQRDDADIRIAAPGDAAR